MTAEVLILAFNRPKHLFALLKSLEKNDLAKETKVTVVVDGPRVESDVALTRECAAIASAEFAFGGLKVISRTVNLGLAESVIRAVTWKFEDVSRLIVLEDDLIVSRTFLLFMNTALQKYEKETKVASIQGYQYPGIHLPNGPAFLKGADCWGWATWRDRWRDTVFDPEILLERFNSPEIIDSFNLDAAKPNYQMLADVKRGRINSWAIRWHASNFLDNRVSLFPAISLVENRGSDGSGMNSGSTNIFDTDISHLEVESLPDEIIESVLFREQLSTFFRGIYHERYLLKVQKLLKHLVHDQFRKLN